MRSLLCTIVYCILLMGVEHGLQAPPITSPQLKYLPGALTSLARSGMPEVSIPLANVYSARPWVTGIGMYGLPDDPVTKLIRDPKIGLFKVENRTIKPTALKSNPAYGLTIANPAIATAALQNILSGDIYSDAARRELSQYWRDQYRQEFPKEKFTQPRTDELIDLLARSTESTQKPGALLPAQTVPAIILAQQGLLEHDPARLAAIVSALKSKGLATHEPLESSVRYSPQELKELSQQLSQISPAGLQLLLEQKPEELVATDVFEKGMGAPLPAAPERAKFCYRSNPEVANCMETGLHDLVDIIVWNREKGQFDPEGMLPAGKASNKLIEFYQQHPEGTESAVNNARQDWFNMVSEIPGVVYKKTNHEVRANLYNALQVLNYLFNSNTPDLPTLLIELSTDKQKISATQSKSYTAETDPRATFGNVTFTATGKPGTFSLRTEAHEQGGHGYLVRTLVPNEKAAAWRDLIPQHPHIPAVVSMVPHLPVNALPSSRILHMHAQNSPTYSQLMQNIENMLYYANKKQVADMASYTINILKNNLPVDAEARFEFADACKILIARAYANPTARDLINTVLLPITNTLDLGLAESLSSALRTTMKPTRPLYTLALNRELPDSVAYLVLQDEEFGEDIRNKNYRAEALETLLQQREERLNELVTEHNWRAPTPLYLRNNQIIESFFESLPLRDDSSVATAAHLLQTKFPTITSTLLFNLNRHQEDMLVQLNLATGRYRNDDRYLHLTWPLIESLIHPTTQSIHQDPAKIEQIATKLLKTYVLRRSCPQGQEPQLTQWIEESVIPYLDAQPATPERNELREAIEDKWKSLKE